MSGSLKITKVKRDSVTVARNTVSQVFTQFKLKKGLLATDLLLCDLLQNYWSGQCTEEDLKSGLTSLVPDNLALLTLYDLARERKEEGAR